MTVDVDNVNSEIVAIWKTHSGYLDNKKPEGETIWPRWPALYDELDEEPDVLYVGLNPSFVVSELRNRIEESPYSLDLADLEWRGFESEVAEFLRWERSYAKQEYSYFKPMRDFAEKYDLSWAHIDVFVSRLTSQQKLNDVLDLDGYAQGDYQQHPFLEKQLDLFLDLLVEIDPLVIVIENAYARDFLKQTRLTDDRYDLTPENDVDPDTGYQTIQLENRTPIFFSGMLTGQRALDVGSRQRLGWHIKEAVSNVESHRGN